MSGFIAWEGVSPLTGDPCVLIITQRSLNAKTGPMSQAWLLLRDVPPFEAVKTRADAAICGGCQHRGLAGAKRTCYVSLFTGPTGIYRTYQAGGYQRIEDVRTALTGEMVRVTAYGDPVILPFRWWRTALQRTAAWVGYTHLWRICDQRYRSLLMASVDSLAEQIEAASMGWRTFRVRRAVEAVSPMEFVCPASEEGGHRATCARCRLCRGTDSPAKSVVIIRHERAPQLTGARGKYGAMRRVLDSGAPVVIAETPRTTARILLALRMGYRRRRETRHLSTHRTASGLEVRLS